MLNHILEVLSKFLRYKSCFSCDSTVKKLLCSKELCPDCQINVRVSTINYRLSSINYVYLLNEGPSI